MHKPLASMGTMNPNHPGQPSTKWAAPSASVRELIRRGAEIALNAPAEWLDEIDQATMAADTMKIVANDPVLAAGARRSNRANLIHWAAANIQNPGAAVGPNLGPDTLTMARELVRRGAGESSLNSYRTGQAAAWLRWMDIAFALTSDPQELRELLNISAKSIAAFVDATIDGLSAQMRAERDELMRETHADRREVVSLILDGAPIDSRHASQRMGYDLDQPHHAAIVWSEEPRSKLSALELAAEALALAAGAQRALTVVASAATLWVWVRGNKALDLDQFRTATNRLPGVRIAIGPVGRGIEGFRRGHLDALTTQRMLARLRSNERIVTFDMVRLVSLMTADPEAAHQFVMHTLGDLASSPPPLRQALLTFLSTGCNATQAAERLHTHRNTLLRRLARAEELLPRPLEQNRIHVAAALEAHRWEATGHELPSVPQRPAK